MHKKLLRLELNWQNNSKYRYYFYLRSLFHRYQIGCVIAVLYL